ncbi:MAG: dodecin family protein [Cocleimonas sp.]|nr:dodecin domain-containing protein [Leucothrix sp.]
MTVAKITEITSSSKKSFEDAVENGVERANKTLKNVTSAWVADQSVSVTNGKVSDYNVRLKITFILE